MEIFFNIDSYLHTNYFYLLLLLIPFIVWYVLKHRTLPVTMQMSSTEVARKTGNSFRISLTHVPFVLRILTLILLVAVLARPQSEKDWAETETQGISIAIAIDVSSSMLAMDFRPNRLEASKEVATQFISGRENDKMSIVVFSGETFTQCPLTSDKAVLTNLMQELECGMIEDGTAVGLGLANAIGRLKDSNTKSKVVILLTDGVNNTGDVPPLTAAKMAKTYGIRVYTIGVGTKGMARVLVQDRHGNSFYNMQKVEIDEKTLTEISDMTGGEYFRATNKESLNQIYKEIDKLEKTKIEVKEHSKKKEEYLPLAYLAGILLLIEILLSNSIS